MKKKVLGILLCAAMSAQLFVACGDNKPAAGPGDSVASQIEANTIGTKLEVQFIEEIAKEKDVEKVADALTTNPELDGLAMAVMPVEEGYLNGFESEVTGFKSGAMFAPMIGTIPFVGYVFESDDAEGLKAQLEEKAMLNWNICTVADEMVVYSDGSYVFFVMAPESFE